MSEISGNSYKWPELLEMADIDSKLLEMFQIFIFYSVKTHNIVYYQDSYLKRNLFNYFCASEKVWTEAMLIKGPNLKEEFNYFLLSNI